MEKRKREYVDKNHKVENIYYNLYQQYNGRNANFIKKQLKQLIEKDPYYFESYLFLYEILQDEGNLLEAEKVLNKAYIKTLELIKDKDGNWPDLLEWGWIENRHIIKVILNKAISLWINKKNNDALDLFRKLLKTNPNDNIGVRFYILAIRMNLDFKNFEKRFNKGGFYNMDLSNWFHKNYKKFPDEFDWWEKS